MAEIVFEIKSRLALIQVGGQEGIKRQGSTCSSSTLGFGFGFGVDNVIEGYSQVSAIQRKEYGASLHHLTKNREK